MKNIIIITVVLLVSPASSFADPVAALPPEQSADRETTESMVVTVDGQSVTDETALLKLRLMLSQAGIKEPVLRLETWTSIRSGGGRSQLDAFTSIVTGMRFVERVPNQNMRGAVWSGEVTNARRQQAVEVAVPDSWRIAIERLTRETPVDTTGIRLGRVVIDGDVVTDELVLLKLRILIRRAGVEQEILLIETRVQQRTHENTPYDPQVDGLTTIATASTMIEGIPSTDVRNTRWKAGDTEGERRAKQAAIMSSWEKTLARIAPAKVYVQ